MQSLHELVRLARRIHATYEQWAAHALREQQPDWKLLERRFQQAEQQRQLMEKARTRGWHRAANIHLIHLQSVLRAVADSVRETQEKLLTLPHRVPSLQDLLAELTNIDQEFDEAVIDKNFLSVQTNTIVLEDTSLGRFLMRLQWPRLPHGNLLDCVEVVALDPNPAKGNAEVPHPHVKNRVLCAGDATIPLQKALEQGRFTDAFHLIRSVLETYNSQSAYASLDDWEGGTCWSCSCCTSEDDRYFCESCERDMCSDCISTCKHCDRTRCTSCQTRCDVCNEPCCSRCLTTSDCSELCCCKDCLRTCVDCGDDVASSELDEAERCATCQEKETTPETEEPENDALIPSAS